MQGLDDKVALGHPAQRDDLSQTLQPRIGQAVEVGGEELEDVKDFCGAAKVGRRGQHCRVAKNVAYLAFGVWNNGHLLRQAAHLRQDGEDLIQPCQANSKGSGDGAIDVLVYIHPRQRAKLPLKNVGQAVVLAKPDVTALSKFVGIAFNDVAGADLPCKACGKSRPCCARGHCADV